jgi:hypothetical protein
VNPTPFVPVTRKDRTDEKFKHPDISLSFGFQSSTAAIEILGHVSTRVILATTNEASGTMVQRTSRK